MTTTQTRYFPEEFAARYRAAGYWTGETFAGFLPEAAERFGDAEALVEARPPRQADPVAGLEHRLHPARAPAMHEPEVAAVGPGHEFEDDAGLALAAQAEHQGLVGPLHARVLRRRRGDASALRPFRLQVNAVSPKAGNSIGSPSH